MTDERGGYVASGIGRFEAVVIDVGDIERAMAFWSGVVGEPFGPSVQPEYRRATLASGLNVVLQLVPETKTGKNRVHVDIEVADLQAGLVSVQELGGSFVQAVDNGQGGFFVCADPDGNEFCLTLP